jgi:hypothetical protein
MKNVIVCVVAVVAAIGLAPIATADTTGTVKERTQRTSAPNLGSQTGWWEVGTPVSLECSTHGQAVKGFFSFNIPGGFDDLWYRTPSGDYITDVDIETGTLNSITPDCRDLDAQRQQVQAPPQPQTQSQSQGPTVSRDLGPVNEDLIRQYCNQAMGLNILGAAGPADFNNPYSWKCGTTPWIWNGPGVDMNAVCVMQFGPGVSSYVSDQHSAHAWRCHR